MGPDTRRLRRRGQGELEAQVLAVLHSANGPATAGWVQEHLDGALAYTTVITILSRLYAKNAVTRSREGRSYTWTSASDEAGLAALRMRRVLDGERDRDAVLAHFISALSPGDEERLRALLARAAAPDDPGEPAGPDSPCGPRDPSDPGNSPDAEGR
ncbi:MULTISPECIES: BlaI/MecI/CopY family transcriptional regulator [unclassified Streptomyces]|uniref:BlaI/MecI/CopY family transcriptional regulator n=1 Tax=unclassified Streptomyces TaxID=2593676 RepID=UPI0022542DE2|nr:MULTISPECIES: BlaI/MecI/CopY family transcriptional regulator [unclassified Streptomyces]MCX4796407.1 BlaI/MecI/CopY family transcriptional regulator [Streptomyces sp. NBC_01242]WSJ41095.1 BlaI/MecI/CopY family transcriptional regulator [Streptomyces sp. NBC_01321]WSP67431.1 BlaI/MecI/CopY family transcriptional regulator [Streptomyces sp. NBC_01240]